MTAIDLSDDVAGLEDADNILRALSYQARSCETLGSPMNAFLIRAIMDDYRAGGVSADILAGWRDRDPMETVIGLRIVGGLHFLVLGGDAPELAAFYPTAGGTFREAGFWTAAESTLRRHQPFFESFMRNTPQTNEVRRSGVLIGGFMMVAAETGLPLRCLEVGASAGLNLRWDRFHYDFGNGRSWGDPESAVRIRTDWRGEAPAVSQSLRLASSEGCDRNPVDLTRPDATCRLKSYVWPDQTERFAMLAGALDIAARHPASLEQADAAVWTAEKLASPAEGKATVVYHSLAAQYFDPSTYAAFENAILTAGAGATAEAPLAWLRFEVTDAAKHPEVRLTVWPGGEDRHLGHAHPHGAFVDWAAR
jgi:hypothetical protein